MKRPRKKWLLVFAFMALLAAATGMYLYDLVYGPNTAFQEDSRLILIHQEMPITVFLNEYTSKGLISDVASFKRVAGWKNAEKIRAGRYRIRRGMSNNQVINMLRGGMQEAISLRTDNAHSIYELAGKLGKNMRSDSLAFIQAFTDEVICRGYGFNSVTIACMIRPDTYDFLWTMTPKEFLEKMNVLHRQYWTAEKQEKARRQNLDISNAYILASIVKAECVKKEEAPVIAGLYLNRLKIDMALQADPTALFAAGLRNVSRVYYQSTTLDSPYNTYVNRGLPPGPIDFVEPVYLDAVIQPATHDYLYMCAQPGATGFHNFARTYEQHLVNKREYTNWLDKKKIK